MDNIDASTWEIFNFSCVFCFKRGKRYKKEDHTSGEIPYISSTKFNNGINVYILPPEYMDIHQNAITLNNSGSIGYCFYHPYRFVASDHCTIIDIHEKYNQKLNVYIALFLKPIIEKLKSRYGFAREMSDERLKKENIKLPVNSQGNPNWEYMENYIKEKSESILYNNENMIRKINSKKLLDTSKWQEFYLGGKNGIFTVDKGQEIINNLSLGEYPLISASKYDNANTGFYENHKQLFTKNKITVASNGTVGKSFYHNYDFIATSDINVLSLKYDNILNQYIAQFLCVIIEKEMFRYGWGRKWGKNKMDNSKIKLPIDEGGNPDWQFMENYIKFLPYSYNL